MSLDGCIQYSNHSALRSRPFVYRSLRHIPSDRLHVSSPTWWLKSRLHFSYAGWKDPVRDEFGALRVLNDDIVQVKTAAAQQLLGVCYY